MAFISLDIRRCSKQKRNICFNQCVLILTAIQISEIKMLFIEISLDGKR